jgi:outer membrane protein assembly factor BamB
MSPRRSDGHLGKAETVNQTFLNTNNSLLSCTADGQTVDLFPADDGSGRQEWEVVLLPGRTDVYNIIVSGGVTTDKKFLSCRSDGTKVDLWNVDDGSGRQQWVFLPVKGSGICSYFNIKVNGGVDNGRVYLSCTGDGTRVDLWNMDDGSGRQRWQQQPILG